MYELGLGVGQSYEKALEYYLHAAGSPEETAQNITPRLIAILGLGNFYANGLGVERNTDMAIQWYQLGADGGSQEAAAALEILLQG